VRQRDRDPGGALGRGRTVPDRGTWPRRSPRGRALGRGKSCRALRRGRPGSSGRFADGRWRLGDRQDHARVERLGRQHRGDLLCPHHLPDAVLAVRRGRRASRSRSRTTRRSCGPCPHPPPSG